MPIGRDVTFTWYGHSCVEVVSPFGRRILIDPWFGNPRSTREPESVDQCDILLVTHGHFDHFGDALQIAERTNATWPCMHEMSLWVGPQIPNGEEKVIGMNSGGTVELEGIKITMVPADHSGGDTTPTPGQNPSEVPIYLGQPVGFIVELENAFRFYHAGDTSAFLDFRLIGDIYRPDVAFLPIGGHFTMGPREAALAVQRLGVRTVVPLHYGTFPILAGTPDQLREALKSRRVREVEVLAPEPGEAIT
jgi:L-ascorbate metabolism protein UlaG (beta-lactamase superfamily)